MEEHKAAELRRERQQGLGKPIISGELNGYRIVAVGNTVYWGKWQTFFDFLGHYIKKVLGPEWGNAELSKALADRHPVLQWYDVACRFQSTTILEPGKVFSAPLTGAIAAYYGLAYNLYLLAHNVEVQTRLLRRLKRPESFRGAYYESFVAACAILAGFELALEDESDPTVTHCEFTATSKSSGASYSVEAKSRAPNKPHLDIGNQLYDALRKLANHPRIVFIDVNVPEVPERSKDEWLGEILGALRGREKSLTIDGRPAPPAFVVVTNHPYHYDPGGTGVTRSLLADGFKIPDFGASAEFPSYAAAFRAMQKHADVFRLVKAFRDYQIPTTFDGEIPEFAYGDAERRWAIGESYDLSEFEQNASGVLTTAAVPESERVAKLAFRLHDGRNVIADAPLSDAELIAYRQHPETFFGAHLPVGRNMSDPFDLFLFFHESYKHTPRERLLSFVKSAPDQAALAGLSTEDLLLEICERWVAGVVQASGTGSGTSG